MFRLISIIIWWQYSCHTACFTIVVRCEFLAKLSLPGSSCNQHKSPCTKFHSVVSICFPLCNSYARFAAFHQNENMYAYWFGRRIIMRMNLIRDRRKKWIKIALTVNRFDWRLKWEKCKKTIGDQNEKTANGNHPTMLWFTRLLFKSFWFVSPFWLATIVWNFNS